MSTTILTSLSTYMSKTSSMTTSKLKFVILKRLNKWKIKKKFRGGSCPGGKCTKVGGGRCHKNRGGRCHKNGGGKCPGGKCNTTLQNHIKGQIWRKEKKQVFSPFLPFSGSLVRNKRGDEINDGEFESVSARWSLSVNCSSPLVGSCHLLATQCAYQYAQSMCWCVVYIN